MRKLFVVKLTKRDRQELEEVTRRSGRGAATPHAVRRAQILLKADQSKGGPAWTDMRICEAFGVSRATVERVRKRYLVEGRANVTAALARKRPPPRARKLDGRAEAHLIATACGAPPDGHKRWTLRLLAGRLVALEEVDSVSHETVRKILKKTRSSRG
jgi:transposase